VSNICILPFLFIFNKGLNFSIDSIESLEFEFMQISIIFASLITSKKAFTCSKFVYITLTCMISGEFIKIVHSVYY